LQTTFGIFAKFLTNHNSAVSFEDLKVALLSFTHAKNRSYAIGYIRQIKTGGITTPQ